MTNRKIVRKIRIVSTNGGSATFNPQLARRENAWHMFLLSQVSPIVTPNEYS